MSISHIDMVDSLGNTLSTKVYSKLCPELLFARIVYLKNIFHVHYFNSLGVDETVKQKEFSSKIEAIEFAEKNVKTLVIEYQAMYGE